LIQLIKEIHLITSINSGPLCDKRGKQKWKEYHLSIFDGSNSSFNWSEIAKRDYLDESLILRSVERYIKEFSKMEVKEDLYSLLHNDYNQNNIFIDLLNNKVVGIIDWGDAIFGDPTYDFSRLRLLFWHYNLWDKVKNYYYKLLGFSSEQKELEDLYFISRVMEYLSYYSRKIDEFSIPRIKAHQSFLRNLD
jgi:thiamine kinase-like enzyme